MGRSIGKAKTPVTISVLPELGIDYSLAASAIPDNALRASINGYYLPGSKKWRSRPGVSCVLTEANKFASRIDAMRPHYNGTTTYLVVASGGHLYAINKATLQGVASSRVFSSIGALSGSGVKPGLATFNTTLFIADRGAATLRYWNSAGTYGLVAGGPTYPSSVIESRNRLWANSTNDADSVWGSKAEWTSTTFTDAGYVQLRAGYGDGMNVVSLCNGPGGTDIVIAKRNKDRGGAHTRRLNITDATPANWFVTDPICTNAAQDNHYAMVQAFNDVWFCGDDGLYNFVGVKEYGDIKVGNVGEKINPLMKISEAVGVGELAYNETLGCVFVLLNRTALFAYTPQNGAFTQWQFGSEVITSTCVLDGVTYFGTEAGRIYALNTDNSTDVSVGSDELTYGTLTTFTSQFRTKTFSFGGYDAMVRRTAVAMTPLQAGTGDVSTVDDNGNMASVFNWTQEDSALRIGGVYATTELIGGTDAGLRKIGQASGAPESRRGFGGPRTDSLAFQVTFSGGARAEVSYLTADIRGTLGV